MNENIKENKMGTMPPMRLLLTMSLPIMLSMFIQALYNIVDSMYVARVSQSALTALALAFPVQMLMTSVAVGTAVGTYSLISRRLGARQQGEASLAAGNGITLAAISSLVFMALGLLFTKQYFAMVADSAETAQAGYEYLSLVMIWCPGCLLSITFEKLLQSTGKTMLSMVTQIVGAVANILLDPIFIFGGFGIPAMGVKGAAVATVIGQFMATAIGIVLVRFKNHELPIRLGQLRLRSKTVGEIYRVGVPSIIMQSIGSVMTFFMNLILKSFSEAAVTVFGIYYKLNSFVFMPIFGLNSGQVPIIGYNYGARKKKRILQTVQSSIIVAVIIMLIGTAIFEFLPEQMFMLFNPTDEILEIGVHAFRVIAICFVPAAVGIMLSGVFQGIGVGIYSMINSITRQLALLVPSAYVLARLCGLYYVWYAFVIAEAASLIMMIWMFLYAKKKYIDPMPD